MTYCIIFKTSTRSKKVYVEMFGKRWKAFIERRKELKARHPKIRFFSSVPKADD